MQEEKFVLFVDKNRSLVNYSCLDSRILSYLGEFLRSKTYKDLSENQSVSLHNPITLKPDSILVIKIDKIKEDNLFDFGKYITNFKKNDHISIFWNFKSSLLPLFRTIQLRSYYFSKTKSKGSIKTVKDTDFIVTDQYKISKTDQLMNNALSEGIYFCRDLVNTPANILNTKEFEIELKKLKRIGVKITVLNEKAIEALGMNMALAVGKGSKNPTKVVILEWKKGKKSEKPFVVIGKGVVFDSGGLSLKSAAGMVDMSMDMAGAAVVAGLFKSVALGKLSVNLTGLIGLVENMPGPNAVRPGDTIKSMKGDMVQVNNTDAEGRLLLADLLWYSQTKIRPKQVIDLATLTGAIIIALGNEYAGVFSNNDKFCNDFMNVCRKSHEKAWRLPLDKKFGDKLSSNVADLSNVGGRQGSSIVAAMFLKNFVRDETPWIHLDIAGVAKNVETTFSNGGATAWGLISLFEYLKEYN
ncbi:leucyl aminopeptidase [Paracoccaceae bacterium]|nr:leucyl aminopeptidase [Paracoccaceae bacterium]